MAKGISLHIGLNVVNPKIYGDEYRLNGCINDANEMSKIAKSVGYTESIMLLDKDATISKVTNAIKAAATKIEKDDIFFLTYSGHGSSVPDLNRDEEDGKDETWCLYDGMLIDDSLYDLFALFKEGTRVLVLSDSCHSGTITKEIHYNLMRDDNRSNKYLYKFINSKIAEKIVSKDLIVRTTPKLDITATVKSISGCQDNQLSRDGDKNGLFTGNLLKIWDNGKFQGSYRTFFKEIIKLMPPDQTPNYTTIGKKNSKFDKEKPFNI